MICSLNPPLTTITKKTSDLTLEKYMEKSPLKAGPVCLCNSTLTSKNQSCKTEFKQDTLKTLVIPKRKKNQECRSGIARDKLKYIKLFVFSNQIQPNEIKKMMMIRARSVKVMKSREIVSLPTAKMDQEIGKHFLRE